MYRLAQCSIALLPRHPGPGEPPGCLWAPLSGRPLLVWEMNTANCVGAKTSSRQLRSPQPGLAGGGDGPEGANPLTPNLALLQVENGLDALNAALAAGFEAFDKVIWAPPWGPPSTSHADLCGSRAGGPAGRAARPGWLAGWAPPTGCAARSGAMPCQLCPAALPLLARDAWERRGKERPCKEMQRPWMEGGLAFALPATCPLPLAYPPP
jgi:hypothetical protein